jgi:hypothetical protein
MYRLPAYQVILFRVGLHSDSRRRCVTSRGLGDSMTLIGQFNRRQYYFVIGPIPVLYAQVVRPKNNHKTLSFGTLHHE